MFRPNAAVHVQAHATGDTLFHVMRNFRLIHALSLVAMLLPMTLVGCQSARQRPASDQPHWLADLLPGFGEPTAGQIARDAFYVYSPDRRREAVDRLSAAPFGGEPVYVRMYRLLIDDPDASVRASCVKALGLHGSPADVRRILPMLEEDASFVRWEAAKALQKLHDPAAVSPLAAAVQNDEDADVRQDAARALGQYRTSTAFQSLVGALHDTNHGVARAARDALITLTGEDQGTEARDWLSWAADRRGRDGLFANARQYTYQPWTPIPSFFKRPGRYFADPLAEPQRPAGIESDNG
ncbi:HEAT repeat domain-containing protein [Phycisphaerales bacterium AB-hyl4]|uniref:HEAT repeat domain-containing protein n=1 Tax=Natronomicrosphaera hydrolytica TaxID=3242702 RepID=A0ABV4U5S7_9BACT